MAGVCLTFDPSVTGPADRIYNIQHLTPPQKKIYPAPDDNRNLTIIRNRQSLAYKFNGPNINTNSNRDRNHNPEY